MGDRAGLKTWIDERMGNLEEDPTYREMRDMEENPTYRGMNSNFSEE